MGWLSLRNKATDKTAATGTVERPQQPAQATSPPEKRGHIELASEQEREQARWAAFVRGQDLRSNVFRLGRWP
jgi:hypothetical protein